MIKSIRFNDTCEKFKKGINYLNSQDVMEACATSFGGFCEQFDKGTGRRIEINSNEQELSVSTHAVINDKNFYFTRCYTNFRSDTTELDNKQDIVKYAKQLQKKINNGKEKNNIVLPVFAYYNEAIKYEDANVSVFNNNECLTNRTFGYSNCLIVKDHFEVSQQYYLFSSFLSWQKFISNKQDVFYDNFKKCNDILLKSIRKFHYTNIKYDILKEGIVVTKDNKDILLSNIDDDSMMFIAIILDLLMRSMMLNTNIKNIFDAEGVVCISYPFRPSDLDTLNHIILDTFPNFQIFSF